MKNTLEIIIPTYNRLNNLKKTMSKFLDIGSPVKECNITILDNCSLDDTENYCNILRKSNHNIIYIRHKKNIGMGANIAKAMEIAEKPYFWIVGDDDSYDFSGWEEVEIAIANQIDCVVVADSTLVNSSDGSYLSQLGLLSAGIYKTANITSDVLQNAYANIINMFPHIALVCQLINDSKSFAVTSLPITKWGISNPDPDGKAYIRGSSKENNLTPRLRDMFLIPAWFNTLEMIKDETKRKMIVNNTLKFSKLYGKLSFFKFISDQILINRLMFNNNKQNLNDLFRQLYFTNKCRFITAWLYIKFIKYPKKKKS